MSSSTAAQELEMIVGEECRGHGGESRECWEEVCRAVLKQGKLQSGKVFELSKHLHCKLIFGFTL